MNRLELAGWATIARELLGLKWGDAEALRELTLNAGSYIPHERLDGCSREYSTTRRGRGHISKRLPTRIARIRGALTDMGFPPSVIENQPCVGYAMPKHHAARLRAIIEGGTSQRIAA